MDRTENYNSNNMEYFQGTYLTKMTEVEKNRAKNLIGFPVYMFREKHGGLQAKPEIEPITYYDFLEMSLKNEKKKDNYYSVLNTPFGRSFNHFIPIYNGRKQFVLDIELIKKSIAIIRFGEKGNRYHEFRPEMILEVFPSLLNKLTLRLIQNNTRDNSYIVTAYFQLYRLMRCLLNLYPYLWDDINKYAHNFCDNMTYRNKKNSGDIGELIFKLHLSNMSYNDFKTELIKEHFARQVFYVKKHHNGQMLDFHKPSYLKEMFDTSVISNQLYLFHHHLAKFFTTEEFTEEISKNLDVRMILKERVTALHTLIGRIQNTIKNFLIFTQAAEVTDIIPNPSTLIEFLLEAEVIAKKQQYLRNERD